MFVAGIQTGRMTGASARIRYYTFMKYLKCDKTDNPEEADVVYFQKKSSQDIIELARRLKRMGKKIVFDCDDGDGIRDKKDRNDLAMFEIADAITTDTWDRAFEFIKKTNTKVYVVPDCIDYGISITDKAEIRQEVFTVGTFGTHKVLEATYDTIRQISRIRKQYYICDRKISKYEKIGWELIPWDINTFVNNLKRFDLCVLLHPNDKTGSLKSNNRLLVCMALGIPTIVSNTPNYSETMSCAMLGSYVITDGIKRRLPILLDLATRCLCSNKMREYVWKHYSPQISANTLEQVFRRVYDSSI